MTEFLNLNKFPSYIIEVGVLTGAKKRKYTHLEITNAELMFIHENGSPLHHIPARPVLQITINWANKTGLVKDVTKKCIDTYLNTGKLEKVDVIIKKFCLQLQNYARQVIYTSDLLVPNSPYTIKKKGSDRPLLDTGQLVRSITCRAMRINSEGKLEKILY